MTKIPFTKMHGAGNDFVVIDNRAGEYRIDSAAAAKIAARRFGVGCDQLVVMESPSNRHPVGGAAAAQDLGDSAQSTDDDSQNDGAADVRMLIFNNDGSEVAACGNATRCVGWRLIQESGKEIVTIETKAGRLIVQCAEDPCQVSVDMGEPRWDWESIPLAEPRNTEHLGISDGALMDPAAVNVGNPHMVFFVPDVDFAAIDKHGPALETHPLFTEGANVSAAQVIDSETIKLVVWERGAGQTLACGTAACAALVAGVRRQLVGRKANVQLPGGDLFIEWRESDNRILMTGPVAEVFSGAFEREFIR